MVSDEVAAISKAAGIPAMALDAARLEETADIIVDADFRAWLIVTAFTTPLANARRARVYGDRAEPPVGAFLVALAMLHAATAEAGEIPGTILIADTG